MPGSEPVSGIKYYFVWMLGEPCRPPAKSTVGQNMMAALAHKVEIGVVLVRPVVVNMSDVEVFSREIFNGPSGFIRKEEEDGVTEFFIHLPEGFPIVIQSDGAVHLVGLWVGDEVAASDVDRDAIGRGKDFFFRCLILFPEGCLEGNFLAKNGTDVLKVPWALPVANEIGWPSDVQEFGMETKCGFSDDPLAVNGPKFIEDGIEESDGILSPKDVEAEFVFAGCDGGIDIEVVQTIVAKAAVCEFFNIQLQGKPCAVCRAAPHRILE